MRKHLFYAIFLLALSPDTLQAQKEFVSLGTLHLSLRQYNSVVADDNGRFIIATCTPERRQFRVYDAKGEFVSSSTIKDVYSKKLTGPIGYLQDSTKVTYYFTPRLNKFDLEKITVHKYSDEIQREDIDLFKGRARIVTGISEENKLTILLYHLKSKQIGYIQTDTSGNLDHGFLNSDQSTVEMLRHVDDFHLVTDTSEPEPSQLISRAKIYPRGLDNYLITIDPSEMEDRGIIKLIGLDFKKRQLSYNRLLNGVSLKDDAIASFVDGDVLYRLIADRSFLDLTVFELKSQAILKNFHFKQGDDFTLPQSKVQTLGKRSDETLTDVSKIFINLAKGSPMLWITNDQGRFKRIFIGSYSLVNVPSSVIFYPSNDSSFPGVTDELSRHPLIYNNRITRFQFLFDIETQSVVEQKITNTSVYDRLTRYSRQNQKEYLSLFSFRFPGNQILMASQSIKTGVVKLIRFKDY